MIIDSIINYRILVFVFFDGIYRVLSIFGEFFFLKWL